MISMTIAHVDLFFDLRSILLYIFGRIAFPIFAFLIANGAYYTKSLKKYAIRLFVFALIAQPPYVAINRMRDSGFWELNILFTLLFGLLLIALYKKIKYQVIRWFLILVTLFFADIMSVDYGITGVLSILFFYIFRRKPIKLVSSQILTFTLAEIVSLPPLPVLSFLSVYQILHFIPFSLFALVPIFLYNNKQGLKMKYFFYIYYPLHFVILLFLIRLLK